MKQNVSLRSSYHYKLNNIFILGIPLNLPASINKGSMPKRS